MEGIGLFGVLFVCFRRNWGYSWCFFLLLSVVIGFWEKAKNFSNIFFENPARNFLK